MPSISRVAARFCRVLTWFLDAPEAIPPGQSLVKALHPYGRREIPWGLARDFGQNTDLLSRLGSEHGVDSSFSVVVRFRRYLFA